jgi:hypothetical protein
VAGKLSQYFEIDQEIPDQYQSGGQASRFVVDDVLSADPVAD